MVATNSPHMQMAAMVMTVVMMVMVVVVHWLHDAVRPITDDTSYLKTQGISTARLWHIIDSSYRAAYCYIDQASLNPCRLEVLIKCNRSSNPCHSIAYCTIFKYAMLQNNWFMLRSSMCHYAQITLIT